MKNAISKKKQEGFTIIEVLIVLAIAGLILLIVFLAVPALQRNSRNTQRKNEAGALASAYSEYVNNHGGAKPTATAQVTDNAKLNFFDPANVTLATALTNATDAVPAAPDSDHVLLLANAKCDSADPEGYKTDQTGMVSYSSRGGVIIYTVEGGKTDGSKDSPTCISAN